jgi:hypothetical protein
MRIRDLFIYYFLFFSFNYFYAIGEKINEKQKV